MIWSMEVHVCCSFCQKKPDLLVRGELLGPKLLNFQLQRGKLVRNIVFVETVKLTGRSATDNIKLLQLARTRLWGVLWGNLSDLSANKH